MKISWTGFAHKKKIALAGVILVVLMLTVAFAYTKVQGSEDLDSGKHTKDYIDFVDKFDAAIDSRNKEIVITTGGKNNVFGTKHNYDLNVGSQVISIYEFESKSEANKIKVEKYKDNIYPIEII